MSAQPAITVDPTAAAQNRYNLALHRLESVGTRALAEQVAAAVSTIESHKPDFELYLHDAVRSRDERLIGKLVLRALEHHRHHQALAACE